MAHSDTPRLARRGFLGSAAAGALALVLPSRLRSRGGFALPLAQAAGPARFKMRLAIPKVLSGANIKIAIKQAELAILPGRKTRLWTYAGSFPGPTIRRPAGQTTRVTFEHELPESAGELTVHLHGGHNSSADDGQPGGLTANHPRSLYCDISPGLSPERSGNNLLIQPGEQRTYTYALSEDGAPERAAFQWYHDHRLDDTARNVWRGLAGMWIIDDDADAALPLPKGDRDIPLMLTDRSFDRHNQLTDPFRNPQNPPFDGVTGRYVLVNGAVLPTHRVSPRRYRLRILNASNFRLYNVYLTGGVKITQIATEAGLMPAPLDRNRVLIGPGERVELLVDFAGARGRRIRLRSGKRGGDQHGSNTYRGALMEFRVGERPRADDTSVPATLRPLPAWVGEASPQPTHRWKITVGGGIFPSWLINGRSFDPAYVEVKPEIDSTVTWELINGTAVAHLFHLHHTDWYMLSRNGRPPRRWERCLKETFLLDPGEHVVVAGHLSDHLGKFVVHCHMLDHEDHGLMSQFEVVAAQP